MTVRITGNDYRTLTPPPLGEWTPSLRVSVVVPAYGGQDKLDLVLAGLAVQTYPAALTEVVVVDNGSEPPLRLPELRPGNTRLITCSVPGRAHARNAGLAAATGDVIHWLDSDVILDRRSVEAHMRWHHAAPYLVVTGYLRFTPAKPPAPDVVAATDDLAGLFEPAEPHAWLVDLIERTDGLTTRPHRAFSLHVGGATSVNAALLAQAGPMDTELVLGQDTEMGYRLAQAGAVFVPEPLSRAFHLGPTMRMRDKASIDRVSHAFVADRIPSYRWLRSHPARQWKVPYVEVVVEPPAGGAGGPAAADADGRTAAGGTPPAGDPGGRTAGYAYDEVRATVDAVLAGTVPDVVVTLTGPWDRVGAEGRAPLDDPDLDLVLVRGHYAHEPRVRFVPGEAPPAGAVPYRLRLPVGWVPGEDTLARLLDLAGDEEYGLVCVLLSEGGGDAVPGVVAARLERTAAFARAAIVREEGEDLDDAVENTFGVIWVDGESHGFTREARPPAGRRSAYRARAEAEAEVARLTKEAERLRGQVARWREEAGRWRRSAVELRREVGELRREAAALRKELAAARKIVQYGLLTSVKRAITRRR
ncbi:glycosyltransferase involved in cell wall biosynthesis [Streptosporangium becharense]|uniref:Glycosyltransferase involved in cell wall biosynthesis n=1 Tax=Streptosporangium becharense TaxID=1816182 RepID=A0A7W9MG71_9ACTN|nr:glycosyltransferase family 2 protein [Streptosporangium becharense]MBB2909911.1 glycosyltransferase involved in cell wall biosynthesis [Streptosporangium becharense]MBB5819134.1 glycosyltransferase involved in cell wall biosynthesis [Streptosporangium becharense]